MNIKTSLQSALNQNDPPRMDKLMSLLGGTIRLDILRLLLVKTESVSDLAEKLDHSIGLTSHNLKLLREQGLVCSQRAARLRYYSLSPNILVEHQGSQTQARLTFTAAEGEQVQLLVTLPTEQSEAQDHLIQSDRGSIGRFTDVNRQP
jgi:DNA-binding transcriptional ArsR family regulator